jgi:zinc transport system substrate-binding protein
MFATLAAVVLVTSGCGAKKQSTGSRMLVMASIAPLADFARQVGGDRVKVELMVPSGASPHTYQIRPDQMDTVSKAAILVLNGVELEYWADKVIDAAANPKLVVVRTADGLSIIDSADDHAHEHGGNPHVWLDPIYAIHQVEAIRDAFIDADPGNAEAYRENAAAYVTKLKTLDTEIKDRVKRFRSKQFIAFHPAWVYFAQRYGLVQAAVIEEWPGKEPPPSKIKEIVQTAKRLNARAIFAEPQLSAKAAQVVAEEAGANVLFLNPLDGPPNTGYLGMMRANVDQMEMALR